MQRQVFNKLWPIHEERFKLILERASNAAGSEVAGMMGWSSGDFGPDQCEILDALFEDYLRALMAMAEMNGLIPPVVYEVHVNREPVLVAPFEHEAEKYVADRDWSKHIYVHGGDCDVAIIKRETVQHG